MQILYKRELRASGYVPEKPTEVLIKATVKFNLPD
jgi:hypothetical protein